MTVFRRIGNIVWNQRNFRSVLSLFNTVSVNYIYVLS